MRTELELRHLRVFVAVVEAGGHTRAARSLGLSQSTVSETLAALERAIGTVLFRKSAKGQVLTPSGEALVPYARRMLALAGELMTELAALSTTVRATLVVAAVESLSAYVLPSRLAALRARWPKLRVEVRTGSCADIRDSVGAGRIDVGLVLETDTGADDPSILARTRLVIVGAGAHPLARRSAAADDLRRCDFYMSDAAGSYHQALRQPFEAAEVPAPRTHTMGTVEGVKRGVLAGGTALGLLPAHAVAAELGDGSLVEVGISPALPGLVLRAVRAPGQPPSPIVDALLGSLRDAFGPI